MDDEFAELCKKYNIKKEVVTGFGQIIKYSYRLFQTNFENNIRLHQTARSSATVHSITSELEAISVDSSTDGDRAPAQVKPEPAESTSVEFRVDPRVHPITSDSDKPVAGPSCAFPSVRRSVRPRRWIDGILPTNGTTTIVTVVTSQKLARFSPTSFVRLQLGL